MAHVTSHMHRLELVTWNHSPTKEPGRPPSHVLRRGEPERVDNSPVTHSLQCLESPFCLTAMPFEKLFPLPEALILTSHLGNTCPEKLALDLPLCWEPLLQALSAPLTLYENWLFIDISPYIVCSFLDWEFHEHQGLKILFTTLPIVPAQMPIMKNTQNVLNE